MNKKREAEFDLQDNLEFIKFVVLINNEKVELPDYLFLILDGEQTTLAQVKVYIQDIYKINYDNIVVEIRRNKRLVKLTGMDMNVEIQENDDLYITFKGDDKNVVPSTLKVGFNSAAEKTSFSNVEESYVGESIDGVPNGSGILTKLNLKYEGDFKDGKPEGLGNMKNFRRLVF